jgi:hypothetical protein
MKRIIKDPQKICLTLVLTVGGPKEQLKKTERIPGWLEQNTFF